MANPEREMQVLFDDLAAVVKKHMEESYGPERAKDMPAKVAVALLTLSMRYFAATKAPRSVVLDFVKKIVTGEKGFADEEETRLISPQQAMAALLRGGR